MKTKYFMIPVFFMMIMGFRADLSFAEGPMITAANVSGKVSIVRENSIIPVTEGTAFEEDDRILTQEDSQVDVVWKGQWGYRLLAGSESELASTKKSDSRVVMNAGDIIVNMKKIDEDTAFKLETPVLVVAVRGTQFWGRVDSSLESTPTTVAVREGVVEITAKQLNDSVSVQAGQAVDLSSDTAILVTRDAKPGEMQAMELAEQIPV